MTFDWKNYRSEAKILIVWISILQVSTVPVCAQTFKLDSVFNQNFFVLDSVTSGEKSQHQLKLDQHAFLYLITDWSASNTEFNHYRGFTLKNRDIENYRSWYLRYGSKIDIRDFINAMEIQTSFFKEGLISESDWELLEKLSAKYRRLALPLNSKQITGKVIDENDLSPMPQVKVYVGDSVVAITNQNGEFEVGIPDSTNNVLFTFISYEPTLVKVPAPCNYLEIVLRVDVINDYIGARKIKRQRHRHFKTLPEKHQNAFEKGVFRSVQSCGEYVFQE